MSFYIKFVKFLVPIVAAIVAFLFSTPCLCDEKVPLNGHVDSVWGWVIILILLGVAWAMSDNSAVLDAMFLLNIAIILSYIGSATCYKNNSVEDIQIAMVITSFALLAALPNFANLFAAPYVGFITYSFCFSKCTVPKNTNHKPIN